MRLKKIKLAGFKSFVDPTTIPINGSLIGIVGPNGCGKSNIIDAIRWVMGESSPKHLRGDSMADVIFSGSTGRKPVGKASVELIFDNSDGGAPGQYASYAEIAVKREASRDGQSDYYLNRDKCRRKDITDIFLGTGLGPRAYSIIEQGMVTRIIEAKPEDLRGFFEEAAGISRYKERRRETENRIRHARENLERVQDIRKELETQLARLQRQSKAAAKYKELKAQERLLRAQLLALRWRALSQRIEEYDHQLSTRDIALEGIIAEQRAIEAEIETVRSEQIEAGDRFNAVQAEFYSIGAEISNIEQAINHARETQQARSREREQVERAWQDATRHRDADNERLTQLRRDLDEAAPRLSQATQVRDETQQALSAAEAQMQTWQGAWTEFTEAAAEPAKLRDVQQARIRQLEPHIQQLQERATRLADERARIEQEIGNSDAETLRSAVDERERQCEAQEQRLEQVEAQIREARAAEEAIATRLKDLRGTQQSGEARLASLRELQAAALGKHDAALNTWLAARGLTDAPRLAGLLTVEAGWEKAVEAVLSLELGAVCVSDLNGVAGGLGDLKKSALVAFDLSARPSASAASTASSLRSKVRCDAPIDSLLAGVSTAETLDEALSRRANLAAHESVVTRGGVWIGPNWIAVTNEEGVRAGILGRERDIETLTRELTQTNESIAQAEGERAQTQERQRALEQERDELRRSIGEHQRERAALHSQLGHKEAKLAQLTARRSQIALELDEIAALRARDEEELRTAHGLLQEAEARVNEHEQQRANLLAERDRLRAAVDAARSAAAAASEALHRVDMERQTTQTTLASTEQSLARLQEQLRGLEERRGELEAALAANENPEAELRARLEELLQTRLQVEERLNAARQTAGELDQRLREHEHARTQRERAAQEARTALERERMARQELLVRRDTFDEQIREAGFARDTVITELPPELSEESCQTELDQVGTRIERLGPINLVAIEEYEEQSQRKGFLDKQHEDLSQALATLEEAIRKMDRETRTRFKETFDKVNASFQILFPRLFGGGHAYLELVGEDLLESGVSVMARPPGKRNSTIHLLSGGEKALTAVSLLFAIFELNPAPFCLLDEVDAPLDDANVERYSQTLKAMSQHTQLVYITHNKISMEMADVLLGVTMSEPGVSRLVAVDVEEAMEMVAQ